MKPFATRLLAGTALIALATAAHAGERAQSSGTSNQGAAANDAKIEQLEQDIQDLQAQVQDLKRSTADQYADVRTQQAKGVKLTLNNGRPTITADDFTFSLRALVQYDSAYYGQGKVPAGTDFSSGSNFRRARFGFEGTAFKDWYYTFIYDFGGSGNEGSTISSAYIQYNGLAPVHLRIGAFPPSESFDDTTSASDLLFLERAQPTDVARGIAGSDGRDAVQIFAYDDDYFASIAYTGNLVGTAGAFDEQQALVGRLAYRPIASENVNLAFGGDLTYVLKLPDLTAGPNSAHAFSLSERPELNADDNNIRLISSGTLDADHATEWGVEAAGNYYNFYGQGGYFGFLADRRALGNPTHLPDPDFNGWYVQASWILTGESKKYKPETGSWGSPKPNDPFTIDKVGAGAWEVAARYSDLDLDYHAGDFGKTTPFGGIRGGDQRIWSAGINWYPNQVLRFMLDFQHTDVSKLSGAGADADARLDAVSLRTQISF
ncbi:MAG TPA: porin [Rhizomicrobium sp.]|nr:porin [Rhizomicrobium sp.]